MASAIVFYDESLPSSWINERWPTRIRDYSTKEGFEEKNALQLSTSIKEILGEGGTGTSAIVFSQDLVPRQLLRSSPIGPLRDYLDAGGRVVWVGDIPLWTQSFPKRKEQFQGQARETDREEVWQSGLHYAMLPVHPLIAESSSLCEWAPELQNKMKSRWYSLRPVNVQVGGNWNARFDGELSITPLASANVTLIPNAYNALVITRWKKSGRQISSYGVSAGAMGIGGNLTFTEKFPKELSLQRMNLACAWRVSYNKRFPRQGFYRMWDCGDREDDPPSALLEDMLRLARM
jgi:hypothetical protein